MLFLAETLAKMIFIFLKNYYYVTDKVYSTCNFITLSNILGSEKLIRKQSNITVKAAPSY